MKKMFRIYYERLGYKSVRTYKCKTEEQARKSFIKDYGTEITGTYIIKIQTY